jgi:N-acetylglucosamine-6-phosphate deacetylase
LKIITLAPEILSSEELSHIVIWAEARKISLSLGHSKATENQAQKAFQRGFRGITHAWNALGFHQRAPGPLGAALGNPDLYIELIIDQIHVAPTVMEWTQKLHPARRLCFISDCAPAAAMRGAKKTTFGPLQIHLKDGACRLYAPGKPIDGALAGGGKLLTQSFCEWIHHPKVRPTFGQLKKYLPSVTTAPLWALRIPASRLRGHQVQWTVSETGQVSVKPIDSH